MSDAPVTGIVGSQNSAKATATTARNAGKGRLKSWGKWAAILLVSLVVLDAFVDWMRAPSKQNIGDSDKPASQMSQTQPITLLQARWAGVKDGEVLPVGVWSEPLRVPLVQKLVHWPSGESFYYRAQTCIGGRCTDRTLGDNDNGDEIKIMILEAGRGMTKFVLEHK